MARRLAAIDVGTNSVLLLVAELERERIQQILDEGEQITRLGRGTQSSGLLSDKAMQDTLQTIVTFWQRAQALGAEEIHIVATSAVRDAENRQEFADAVMHTTGVELRLLPGDEEAKATYWGATSDPALHDKALRVIDCGGGSTEFTQGVAGRILTRVSIDIGHVRLSEMLLANDPVTDADMKRLQDHVRQEIKNAKIGQKQTGEILVGVGGTITTLAMIDLGLEQYDREQIQGYRLSTERLSELRTWLQKTPLAERKQIAGLPPQRADVIVAGAAIFETVTELLGFDEIIVSTRGLRHGILISASMR